jgi:PKD repeat protein
MIWLVAVSCNKLPEPNFSYTPADNPEAGDTIFFTNSTANATSFKWEFGDGISSVQGNPTHIYDQAGIYEVILTAKNDAGEMVASQSLTINEPTVLAFIVYDSIKSTVLQNADVLLYDNESDYENFEDPLLSTFTDPEGVALFNNLEPVKYYIYIIREQQDGFWFAAGATQELAQNEVNIYEVECIWFPGSKKAASETRHTLKTIGSSSAKLHPIKRIRR